MEDEKHLTFAEAWDRLTPEAKEAVLRELPKTGTQDGQDPKEGWERMPLQERRDLLSRLIAPAIPDMFREDESSDWIRTTFFHLLSNAVHNLHRYLEDATDEDISWESPFVELRIPAGPEAPPVLTTELSDKDLSFEKVVETLASKFLRIREAAVLQELTGGAVIIRRDGVEFPVVPPELAEEMKTWPEKKRRKFEETYGEPFVLGGTYFEEGRDFQTTQAAIKVLTGEASIEDVDVAELTRSGRKRLRKVTSFLTIKGDHDGTPFYGSLIVAFHPLLVDEDRGRTYFPVVVGLHIVGENPAEWTREDRESLWDKVISIVDNLKDEAFPEKPETVSTGPAAQSPETVPPRPQTQETDTTSTKAEIPVASTVDTMEALSRFTPSAPVPMGPPPDSRKARYLWNSETRVPRSTAHFLRHVGKVTLPRRWSAIPKWEDLREKEMASIRNHYGETAFYDTDEGSPALLQNRTRKEIDPGTGQKRNRTEISLTQEAERALEDREGIRGFIRRERDKDGVTREYLVKVISSGEGRIALSVSWYGRALFFAEDGLERRREELEALKRKWEQGDLFEDLPARQRDVIEGLFENMGHVRNARILMDTISRRFGAEGENPVRVPAHDIKVLFGWENDPHGFAKIEGSLRALQEVRFTIKATGSGNYHAFGPFLQHVAYDGRGVGSHGDGDFFLTISPDFVGCLKAFEVRVLKGRAVKAVFDWTRDLDKESEALLKKEPFFKGFTISPFYDKARKLTDHQSNLRAWIENQITQNTSTTAPSRKRFQVKRSAPEAGKPRLYGHDFCPLIPEGTLLAGILGRFKRNAEAGWTLGGTTTSGTKTGGGHVGGLLSVLGYYYPPGAARAERQKAVWDALRDITVVVEGLHGVVAARTSSGWMSLEDVRKSLPEEDLIKKVRWFLFITPDVMDHMGRVVDEYQEKRFLEGKTPHRVKVTPDKKLVEASRERETAETIGTLEEASKAGTPKVGLEWSPLWQQFRAAIKTRKEEEGLTQTKAAELFGVSQPKLFLWIEGKKPIPEELVPLVKRWVDGGEPPTVEELASRRTKRPGVNSDTGKPWTGPRKKGG